MRRNQGGLVVLSCKVPAAVAAEVHRIADESEQTVSVVLGEFLLQALEGDGEKRLKRDLADAGFQAGLRRGVHEAHVAITEAMKKLWRE